MFCNLINDVFWFVKLNIYSLDCFKATVFTHEAINWIPKLFFRTRICVINTVLYFVSGEKNKCFELFLVDRVRLLHIIYSCLLKSALFWVLFLVDRVRLLHRIYSRLLKSAQFYSSHIVVLKLSNIIKHNLT